MEFGADIVEPRVSQIEGRAVVHKAFGGGGVEGRRTPRENAHDALMRCDEPKCFHETEGDPQIHSTDCDHATGLLEQLRALVG